MKSLSLQAINESSSYEVSVVYDGCYQFSQSGSNLFDNEMRALLKPLGLQQY